MNWFIINPISVFWVHQIKLKSIVLIIIYKCEVILFPTFNKVHYLKLEHDPYNEWNRF